eukprot:7301371-Pyramimonas_sp.AAC.2
MSRLKSKGALIPLLDQWGSRLAAAHETTGCLRVHAETRWKHKCVRARGCVFRNASGLLQGCFRVASGLLQGYFR